MFDQIRTQPKSGWGGSSGFTPSELSGPDTSRATSAIDSAVTRDRDLETQRQIKRALASIFDRCSC